MSDDTAAEITAGPDTNPCTCSGTLGAMGSDMQNAGIWGIGTYLPPIVRRNDYWTEDVIQEWRARQQRNLTRNAGADDGQLDHGAMTIVKHMMRFKNDPFEGVVERRVMPEDMRSSDMEIAAARDALERAGVAPSEVDMLLVQTTTPDWLHVPTACRVHDELKLPWKCHTLQTDGMCVAFLQQLIMADAMIRTGQVRIALIIQTCAMSRFLRREDQFSAWFGDGTTAVVVGPVAEGKGLLGVAHATDGHVYGGVVTGIPGKRWYDEGKVIVYLDSPRGAREQFLTIGDTAKPLMDTALEKAGAAREDVAYFACHQASAWLPPAAQELTGLVNARRIDTFPYVSSLSGANVPFVMHEGAREGLLGDGDLVGMYSGAAGMTASAAIFRWGR